MLFVKCLQSLVTLKRAALVKVNIASFFCSSALKWYTLEFRDFNCDALNNNQRVKSWIIILFCRFKVLFSFAFDFLSNKTYLVDDICAQRPPALYVRAIVRYQISCNIVNIANKLFFAYQGIALKLKVYVSPPAKTTKTLEFIFALKEK